MEKSRALLVYTSMAIKIYISNGIGDLLCYFPHFPKQPDVIYWASRARPDLQPVLERIHPEIEHVNLWSDLTPEQERMYHSKGSSDPRFDLPEDVEDWSVHPAFFRCRHILPYRKSSFLTKECADLSHIKLPNRFVVCQHDTPWNTKAMQNNRRLLPEEWNWILKKTKLPIIAFTVPGSSPVPNHKRIIPLQLNVGEVIEVTKRAEGYYGIDSWVSILAAQRFDAENLGVKYHGNWFDSNKDLYMAPHKTFPFVYKQLGKRLDTSMETKVLTRRLTFFRGNTVEPGSVIDVPKETAKAWIANGLAEDWNPYAVNLQKAARTLQEQLLGTKVADTQFLQEDKPKAKRAKKRGDAK